MTAGRRMTGRERICAKEGSIVHSCLPERLLLWRHHISPSSGLIQRLLVFTHHQDWDKKGEDILYQRWRQFEAKHRLQFFASWWGGKSCKNILINHILSTCFLLEQWFLGHIFPPPWLVLLQWHSCDICICLYWLLGGKSRFYLHKLSERSQVLNNLRVWLHTILGF